METTRLQYEAITPPTILRWVAVVAARFKLISEFVKGLVLVSYLIRG